MEKVRQLVKLDKRLHNRETIKTFFTEDFEMRKISAKMALSNLGDEQTQPQLNISFGLSSYLDVFDRVIT